jgi:hypothetical protein
MYLRIYSLSLAANQIQPETGSFRTVRFHEDDILPSFLQYDLLIFFVRAVFCVRTVHLLTCQTASSKRGYQECANPALAAEENVVVFVQCVQAQLSSTPLNRYGRKLKRYLVR